MASGLTWWSSLARVRSMSSATAAMPFDVLTSLLVLVPVTHPATDRRTVHPVAARTMAMKTPVRERLSHRARVGNATRRCP